MQPIVSGVASVARAACSFVLRSLWDCAAFGLSFVFAIALAMPATADSIEGLTADQAAQLSLVKIPLFLPARVPRGYRVYAVDAAADSYDVLYSDGSHSFVVKTELTSTLEYLKGNFEPTGPTRKSRAFGAYRIAQGALKTYNAGCLSHAPPAFTVRGNNYRILSCSLTPDQLADVVASATRMTTIRASPQSDDSAPQMLGLTAEQQRRLRGLPMPVVVFATIPEAFTVTKFSVEGHRHRMSYTIGFSDGHGTLDLSGSNWGFGDGDVPVKRLQVSAHSAVFGDVTLIVDPSDANCITTKAVLSISLTLGYGIRGCKMSPYALKSVIESARLLRPL